MHAAKTENLFSFFMILSILVIWFFIPGLYLIIIAAESRHGHKKTLLQDIYQVLKTVGLRDDPS